MKKDNKLAKLTVLVLLVTLAALILVSSTYAKYTTKVAGSDSATVAKWAINAENNVTDLFKASYTNVKAGTADKAIIAPGTEGEYKFKIAGSVETAYTLKVTAEGTDGINTEDYSPIVYTFQKNSEAAQTCTSFNDLLAKINDIDNGTKHEAGDLTSSTYTIGWKWAFEGDDAKDTALGASVAAGEKTVSLSVDITATQVD